MLNEPTNTVGRSFAGFIGQEHIKSRFRFWLQNYAQGNSMPVAFFEGPKGHGKTEFAKLVHKEAEKIHAKNRMERPRFAEVNCAQFKNATEFFEVLLKPLEGESAVILLDECHKLPEPVQTALLTPFNPSRNTTASIEWRGEIFTIDKKKLTFIFATTNPEKMLEPLYERLTVISFKHYNQSELEKIVQIKIPKDLTIDRNVIEDVARSTRFSPRIITDTVIELEKFASTLPEPVIDMEAWQFYKKTMGILPLGMTENEAEMLSFLMENGASSNQVIAAHLKLDQATVLKKVQSFLLQAGLITITGNSKREITQEGRTIVTHL